MVTFVPMGRLGNYFFEAANCIAYAKKHGLEYSMPFHTSNKIWSPIYLTHLQNKKYNFSLPTIKIEEKQFHYYELPFDESFRNANIILQGYFQSYLRFDAFRKEILEAFNLPYELKPDTCSIHCRFGDYLTITGKHILVDLEYLTKSIETIMDKTGITKFKIFSDDLQYFKDHFDRLYDFEYSTNTNELDDLIEISCCHSQINSSSTFSWFGAWLNQNPDKVIITQKLWFQKGWKEDTREVLTSDLIPQNWIKI